MNILDQDRPYPFTVSCSARCRSPVHLQEVIDQFEVTSEPRYQPQPGKTFCATFATDYCNAMGVVLPTVWGANGGYGIPLGGGFCRLQANDLEEWLAGRDGKDFGWKEVDATTAIQRASCGFPTLAVWKNPDPQRDGHIAPVVPSSSGKVLITQAGAKCLQDAPIEQGFGYLAARFFTHD